MSYTSMLKRKSGIDLIVKNKFHKAEGFTYCTDHAPATFNVFCRKISEKRKCCFATMKGDQ